MLTFFIGSPVCWCCFAHPKPVAAQAEEAPACPMCAKEKTAGHSSSPAPKGSCPCERIGSARELTQPKVAAPSATHTELPIVAWIWEDTAGFIHGSRGVTEEIPAIDTGPPRPAGPLYLRYCALLN